MDTTGAMVLTLRHIIVRRPTSTDTTTTARRGTPIPTRVSAELNQTNSVPRLYTTAQILMADLILIKPPHPLTAPAPVSTRPPHPTGHTHFVRLHDNTTRTA